MRWIALASVLLLGSPAAPADETPLSPYMPKIVGQEEFLYVWTAGEEGIGDGSDKLVTIDLRPGSENYGKVIHVVSVGGRHEAHHADFTVDRKFLWAGGLDDSKIFIFDVHTDPARPRLVKVIGDFIEKSGGVVGPHTFYALPGRMIISGLSNDDDFGGRTALVEYRDDGTYLATYWMPTDDNLQGARKMGRYADGYGYDVRALPRLDVMITSSFTGHRNYMRSLEEVLADPSSREDFGKTVVIWDLDERRPKFIFDAPTSPLEIRCAWHPRHNYCFTSTALTSQLWLIRYDEERDRWSVKPVAEIGDSKKGPLPGGVRLKGGALEGPKTALPVDLSISSDDRSLWVTTFMDGKARLFDISDPDHPREIYQEKIGSQVNMVSQSWDGERVYFSSSLLTKWDKRGEENEQFVKGYRWNGKRLVPLFAIDFFKEGLGRPHQMRFGSSALYR